MNTIRKESLEIILEAGYHRALVRREVGKFKQHEKVQCDYSGIMGGAKEGRGSKEQQEVKSCRTL